MKKKLEAELISIAHRILKMKNRDDVVQLHQEAQKLYENLSILRFYEENIEALKPELSQSVLEEKMELANEKKSEVAPEVKSVVAETVISTPLVEAPVEVPAEDEKVEAPIEEQKEEIADASAEPEKEEEKIVVGEIAIDEDEVEEEPVVAEEPETLLFEPASEEVKEGKKAEPKQISFEELLGNSYHEADFVKVNDVPKEAEKTTETVFEKVVEVEEVPVKDKVVVEEPLSHRPLESIKKEIETEKAEYRALSLNDKFNKTITLTLNDRIAFEKNLFGGSGEDLNRVLSQLNTFNTLEEAKSFIDDLVKPDYNDWKGKDEYSERFMELVEKKFA
ncbi:hypothetical protein FEDK69T_08470 [Flavobacterium enshiense DK69]|uniref:Uncharacterized protein n=1 Tax=Flavobacterium enshiense DK69 TaxID=1107311 RepID=V6SIZ7_9FLAO|nr:hypothetical protein [Flavobacterium enshiense]ESU24400.1 hypothetical protein FEDK69T_08470 [Flavobacterium enshiense DK69]KGO94506.1 hypothetical protein Q767_13135 [Flavobacterium enshiense DK69]